MTTWQMYWLVKCDAIRLFMNVPAWIGVGFFIIGAISFCIGLNDEATRTEQTNAIGFGKRMLIIGLCLIAFFAVPTTLIPSTKEVCAIIVVPKVINSVKGSDMMKGLPNRVVEFAYDWMDEMSPDKIKGVVVDSTSE